MKIKDKKVLYLISSILFVIILFACVLLFVNYSKVNYSFTEKNYINNNTNNVIDISIKGNVPIYSNNGEGVFYDFINALEADTGLTFNTVVNGNYGTILTGKTSLDDTDLVIYNDHYVLLSKNDIDYTKISDLDSNQIAVLSDDLEYIKEYFKEYNLSFNDYSSFERIINDLGTDIQYAIVPLQSNLDKIIENNYKIINHFEGLHYYYVLTLNGDNTLNSIITKFYNNNKELLENSINSNIINLIYDIKGLTDIQKEELINKDIVIGYIENIPIEGKVNGDYIGISGEYYNNFSKLTSVTYKYISYDNVEELKNALDNGKIDIAFNYFNLSSDNYEQSSNIGNANFAILSKINNNLIVNDINDVNGLSVKTINNSTLFKYSTNLSLNVNGYDNYKEMLKDLNDNSVLIVDKITYDYYKNDKLKDFSIRSIENNPIDMNFLLNKNNTIFNEIFNTYISITGYDFIEFNAINNSIDSKNSNVLISFIISNIPYIFTILILGLVLFLTFNKKIKVSKKIKKEDKLKYLDIMTNLKNRNYLNDNLDYWEKNKVYPQAVIVIDLNCLSIINDSKGHEEGDKQIKSAASILIKTQRENSEIIRTDGNEFLIYLVGYDERLIVTYVNKLIKEFKDLPYEYGASLGYAMIMSDSTTIDDAINEALLMMKKNKGEK